ncbi:YgjV family protein [Photobacterium alginatilyticum]|uniref:YgjV family protein n=1 Tax=Photobacterium TaxID=657 RepID=UPI001EF720F6|nr:YgjV family protein [Photobacterium sp. OFAV2-7]MCG7588582.1 YgjV family protein [Photobacterium sp. OFAV2-7]
MEISETIGYAASLLVGMSLLMGDMKRLRYINGLGCLLFVIYGWQLGAYPVVIMNSFCIIVNLYHIHKLSTKTPG